MDGGLIFFTVGSRSKPGTFGIALQQALALQVAGKNRAVVTCMDALMPRAQDAQERPAERHQFLVVAGLTANSQETMLKPAALQVLIKFAVNESG